MLNIKGNITDTFIKKCSKGIEQYKIIGLFSSGLYLINDQKRIIMIHDEKYGLIPFGIGIKNYKDIFIKDNINEDLIAYLDNDKLIIDDISIDFVVNEVINLSQRKGVDTIRYLEIVKKELKNIDKGVFKDLINDDIPENIYSIRLKKALKVNKDNQNNLEEIVGLGPGLTPSGDDFIFGYLYRLINDPLKDIDYLNKLKMKTLSIMDNTNEISKTYYKAILNKEKFSLFEEVCFPKDEEDLKEKIDELFSVGSNSGVDILVGIAYANQKGAL